MQQSQSASLIQMLGAGGLGFVIGWFVYYINRYRRADVQISDLLTLIGAIGGAAITGLFPAKSDLFGAYGIGLFAGFFLYFFSLIVMVGVSENFDGDWFLDGRRKKPQEPYYIPEGFRPTVTSMGQQGPGPRG